MDDQLFHRVFIVYFHQIVKFFRFFHSKSCLNRDPNVTFFEYLVKKGIQSVWVCKESRAPPFCNHCLGWAAQVQINLFVSVFFQFGGSPYKILRFVREYLGYRIHSFVVCRKDILFLSGAEMSHLIWPDKRHEIFVKSAEAFVKGTAENPARNSLQRSKI